MRTKTLRFSHVAVSDDLAANTFWWRRRQKLAGDDGRENG